MANNEMLELVNYKKLDAVIFDMDGVLIDSEPFYAGRFERFFRAFDKPYTQEIKSQLAGASNQLEFEIVRRYWGEDISVDELKSMFKQVNSLIRPDYREIANLGASEVLTRLSEAGLKLALASSSAMETIRLVLESLELTDYFSVIISGNMFRQSKPHPEIYEHTVEMLGTTAGRCVAVEDSTYGIQSAVAAGLRVIAVRDERFGYDQTPADRLIDDLRELPPLLGLKHNQGHW